jgi:DNA-binding transcriptional ArsR family regulator
VSVNQIWLCRRRTDLELFTIPIKAKRMRRPVLDRSEHSSPDEAALRRAVRHPKRLEMLGALAGEKVGADEVELAETLGLSIPLARYHLRILCCADLIASAGEQGQGTATRYVAAASVGN